MSNNESLDKINDELERERKTDELLNSTLDSFNLDAELEEHNVEEMLQSVDESYEDYKRKFEKSKEVVYPNIKPIGQSVITSATLANIMEQRDQISRGNINLQLLEGLKRSVSDVQVVVAVGPSCKEVKVGDLVKLRFTDFVRMKNPNSVHSEETFELPMEQINGRNYLEVHERNIKFIYLK